MTQEASSVAATAVQKAPGPHWLGSVPRGDGSVSWGMQRRPKPQKHCCTGRLLLRELLQGLHRQQQHHQHQRQQ